ncbi:MAG: sulfatase-like hydrolase/transferase, partial [Bacillota bacterium]
METKNIIIFHAESWDGRMLGSMGHPALKEATPNVDALAERGVMFENTYSSHPICCPSRANMWSGKYTHNCESWNNFKGLETNMWAFPEAVSETHNVGFFGKRDYRSGGHTLLARLSAWLGPVNKNRPVFDRDNSQDFKVMDNEKRRCHTGDWEKIDKAVQFLEDQQNEEKPFFLTISSSLVHPHFTTNQYWLDKIPEELVDIPPEDNTEHPAIAYQRMAKAWRYGFDEETVRKVRRIYMAMCAEADALLGELVDAVDNMGLTDDTIIIFLSDHGELALEHQDWYKMSLYEGSVRVPLVIAGPGLEKGLRLPNIVSLIDICPT